MSRSVAFSVRGFYVSRVKGQAWVAHTWQHMVRLPGFGCTGWFQRVVDYAAAYPAPCLLFAVALPAHGPHLAARRGVPFVAHTVPLKEKHPDFSKCFARYPTKTIFAKCGKVFNKFSTNFSTIR